MVMNSMLGEQKRTDDLIQVKMKHLSNSTTYTTQRYVCCAGESVKREGERVRRKENEWQRTKKEGREEKTNSGRGVANAGCLEP